MLANIYIMAVSTVMVWGISQVTLPCIAANVGNRMVGGGGHPDGLVFAVLPRNAAPSGLSFAPVEQVLAWGTMFQSKRPRLRLWSDSVWIQPVGSGATSEVYVGVRYWTALVLLLGTFAAIKFQAYRSRLSRLTM